MGKLLGNRLVLADASETILCAVLAVTTLPGLALFSVFGWWWDDQSPRSSRSPSSAAVSAQTGNAHHVTGVIR